MVANIKGSLYIEELVLAYEAKYNQTNFVPINFGSNTVTRQTSTIADANGDSLTAELDTDTSTGNVAYSAVYANVGVSGKTSYGLIGPSAQASLTNQDIFVYSGSTGTITGSNDFIRLEDKPAGQASGTGRTTVIVSGDNNVILAGSGGGLINTGVGQNDIVFLPSANKQADPGTTLVVDPGTTTVVGSSSKDKLVLLADRLSAGSTSEQSAVLQLGGGVSEGGTANNIYDYFSDNYSAHYVLNPFGDDPNDLFVTVLLTNSWDGSLLIKD